MYVYTTEYTAIQHIYKDQNQTFHWITHGQPNQKCLSIFGPKLWLETSWRRAHQHFNAPHIHSDRCGVTPCAPKIAPMQSLLLYEGRSP